MKMIKNPFELGALKPTKVLGRSLKELNQIAKDIYNNLIFTSLQLRDMHLLSNIFMPILLGAFEKESKEYKDDIGLIFEYYSKVSPMAINGYPIFFSFQYLSKSDTEIVLEKIKKIDEVMKNI